MLHTDWEVGDGETENMTPYKIRACVGTYIHPSMSGEPVVPADFHPIRSRCTEQYRLTIHEKKKPG